MVRRLFRTMRMLIGIALTGLLGFGTWLGIHVNEELKREQILKDPHIHHPLKHAELGASLYYRFVFSGSFEGEPVEVDQPAERRPSLDSGG